MGAEFLTKRLEGGYEKEHIENYMRKIIKEAKYHLSLDKEYYGYSGTWGEVKEGCLFANKTFESEEECYEYIFMNAVKWGKPLAARYRTPSGELFWLIGALASC